MLEPGAIHSYEPPAYRNNPPSRLQGAPPSLPFGCVVLESADATGGPSPALLHSLREHGCKLILAQLEETEETEADSRLAQAMQPRVGSEDSPNRGTRKTALPGSVPKAYKPTSLNHEWYDAVFDKVLYLTGEEGSGNSQLERFFADEGLPSSKAICFACSNAGSAAFSAADVGLILTPSHEMVWHRCDDEEKSLSVAGADCALSQSPTARQLAWLHEVFTQKLWCCCMWLAPAPGELRNTTGLPGDAPSASDRAEISAVRSGTLSALGHPPWASRWPASEGGRPAPCMAQLGDSMCACPDWTPLEPRFRSSGGSLVELVSFPKVSLYCHTLDAGIAKVNHLVEAEGTNGLVVRVSSNRFVSLCREGTACTEMSVTLLQCNGKNWPDICIRSGLDCQHIPKGAVLANKSADISEGCVRLTAVYHVQESGQSMVVRAWHRLCADDGRGDVELSVGGEASSDRTCANARKAHSHWGKVRSGACEVDLIFLNPRRGTRYTVEKVVSIITDSGTSPSLRFQKFLRSRSDLDVDDAENEIFSLIVPEIEEEHLSAWRAEWDKADIEVAGTRRAARFQRAVRLFRFHQVSSEGTVGNLRKRPKVPPLVASLFGVLKNDLCWGESGDRPCSLVYSRVVIHDPRSPPVVRIEPKVPPDCHRIRFNAALGWRWHRFTLTPGTVQILVQGPIMVAAQAQRAHTRTAISEVQLHGDIVHQPPNFFIATSDDYDGVEVRAMPWHEIQVQHALTDLGKPDGSTGGFYGLMRRTRFIKMEVMRRLFAEDGEGPRPGLEGDFRDETLTMPLQNALAYLQSAPRPPGWREGDDKDLHVLEADYTMRTRILLAYEKNELERDILFLKGRFIQKEGRLCNASIANGGDSGESDLLTVEETMTVQEAMTRCHTLPGCGGFYFQGDVTDGPVKVHFRGMGCAVAQAPGWTSFLFEAGEAALVKVLANHYEESFCGPDATCKGSWVEEKIPDWELITERCVNVLRAVADTSSDGRKPFRNLITDRDGTTNNYCDRYASSVQSIYNAAWLSNFARYCVDNAMVVTAAPLGGRPSAEGLLELCVAPRGFFTYTGSKGREYFSDATQQLLEAERLPKEQRELVEELHRRILALCQQQGNTKFMGIGSGLQRKFGEVTMARNDPAGTVPEPESRRFMAAVRRVKEELDPDGTSLDLHDTGTDMEIFPRVMGGRPLFDKGDGVMRLDQKLGLHVAEGPNIVCGDTGSDLPMVIAALRLMCGDKMVDRWQERLRQETVQEDPDADPDLDPEFPPEEDVIEDGLTKEEAELRQKQAQEEADRKAQEEAEEERVAREAASKLAVLFIITPESYKKSPMLAHQVEKWCEMAGAHCALLPSPDVLVYGLARFAEETSGVFVTGHPVMTKEKPEHDKHVK
eukprot:TRINITY_DN31434_c0_g1_i1.p1 TRINITY_DN31434_c0_g1~~TRINITY_DN31434_c0_g1_i1.p1  ORF type:complete len:1398 (-),score=227.92 TRINITY_DN31434_c0_g1_i1:209-4372(-)